MSRNSSALSLGSNKRGSTAGRSTVVAGGDYLNKEDEYSRLNAELEARTASLLKDAESVLKHNEQLLADDEGSQHAIGRNSGRFSYGDVRSEETTLEASNELMSYERDTEDVDDVLELSNGDYSMSLEQQLRANQNSSMSESSRGRVKSAMAPSSNTAATAQNKTRVGAKSAVQTSNKSTGKRPMSGPRTGNKSAGVKSRADYVATPSMAAAETLQTTIARLEKESESNGLNAQFEDADGDDIGVANELGSVAVNRFLKAKLRVLQEELDRLTKEMNKKDQENLKLQQKLKEADDERQKLQKSNQGQASQHEKTKRLMDEWKRKAESSEMQLGVVKKELEAVKRDTSKQGTGKSVTEVRLNRALEEVEKYKVQLAKVNQNQKESSDAERKRMEQLVNENKKLEKQKSELIAGFKKQLKLIDLLKRQRMHIEAAKLLHFTEEEFMKALDLGS